MELRRSFLSELRDQVFMELPMILPFGITGSTHLLNSDNPSFQNYGINTSVELRQSFFLELRDQVFTELPTILPFEITGSTHVIEYRSHRITYGHMSQDDTIPLHSQGPRSPYHFRESA